jgi:hypothetical protein
VGFGVVDATMYTKIIVAIFAARHDDGATAAEIKEITEILTTF